MPICFKNHGKGSGFTLKGPWEDVLAQDKGQEHSSIQDPWCSLGDTLMFSLPSQLMPVRVVNGQHL